MMLIGYGFAHAQNATEDDHAKAMRLSLEAGGMKIKTYPLYSKDYGPFLLKLGFSPVIVVNYIPRKGDIRVFQPYPGGDPEGHVDMYTGHQWVSDFKEDNFWPSAKYKKYHPSFKVYKWLSK